MPRGRPKGSKNKNKPATKKVPAKRIPKVKEPVGSLPIDESAFEVETLIPSKVAYTWSPISFRAVKDRKKGLQIVSKPIDWAALEDFQLDSQWLNCNNFFWEEEKEGRLDRADLEPYFYEYALTVLVSSDVSALKSAKFATTVNMSVLVSCFLLLSGAKSEKYEATVLKVLEGALTELNKAAPPPVIKVKNTVKESDPYWIALETLGNLEKELKPVGTWLVESGVAKPVAQKLKEYAESTPLKDLALYFNGDREAKEYFSRWSRKELIAIRDWWIKAVDDLNSYMLVKRVIKKMRVRKPKPPSKIVNKLKFKFSDEALKLTSVKPETIVGAAALWVYDTKKRKLCVYNASKTDQQLSVKGTYIIGWDPATSTGKILRKPEVQLPEFLASGKVVVKKFLGSIKAVETKLKGKINKDMILLKTY